MNSPLDNHLAQLKRNPMPATGAGFEITVWQRIAERRGLAGSPWWAGWQNPRLALAATAATVAIGFGTALLLPEPLMSDRAALGLEAFAADAPHLPSTLIANR